MKRIFLAIMVVYGLLFTISCTKKPVNEDIEGFWILKSFTTLSDMQTHECERLYYSITYMVTEVAEKGGKRNLKPCVARTEYDDNQTKLILSDFKIRGNTSDLHIDATEEQLKPYGINKQDITVFDVVYCNGKSMVLQSDYARLELERF